MSNSKNKHRIYNILNLKGTLGSIFFLISLIKLLPNWSPLNNNNKRNWERKQMTRRINWKITLAKASISYLTRFINAEMATFEDTISLYFHSIFQALSSFWYETKSTMAFLVLRSRPLLCLRDEESIFFKMFNYTVFHQIRFYKWD